MNRPFLYLVVCLLTFRLTLDAQQLDVFYLSVGSADYIQEAEKLEAGSKPFSNVTGARKSARYVEEFFRDKAGGKGILMRSSPGKLITRNAVLDSLDKVIRLAKKSKSKNPLIVFYYCGHGISEGIAWLQFLVPGDFTKKPQDLATSSTAVDIEKMGQHLLNLAEVTDKLQQSGLSYMCLLDACYEAKEEKFTGMDYFLGETGSQNIKDIAALLRFMNEYHGEHPVVFAAKPGTTVQTVEDPLEDGTYIGPLCRRLMLVKKKNEGAAPTLSLEEFVETLKSESLDSVTPPPVTFYEPGKNGRHILKRK